MSLRDGQLNVLPPLPPGVLLRRPRPLPHPFDDPRCRTYDFGRNALWHGLGALGLGPGDELLMPAYHCGTEVGPVLARGLLPRFWAGTPDLAPDAKELERLRGPRTRGLYLTHHLGLAQDAPRWRRWCEERGLLLLEDAAPAWLATLNGRPLGSWADLAIHSPWKTLGLPDCGALICSSPPPPLSPSRALALRPLLKGFARWPGQRFSPLGRLRRPQVERPEFDPEREFALRDPDRGVSRGSLALLRRLADPGIAAARRRNWEWLRQRLGEWMPAPFDRDPGGGSPAEFPLRAEDRDGLLAHLASRGIGGIAYWSQPHLAAPVGAFPEIDRRRETTVTIPVHQGLRRRDLERLARAVEQWSA